MANIKLSMEELLQLIKGELDTVDLKNKLAQSLLEVWQRDETRRLIEDKGKELAEKKMTRIIESSFVVEQGYWNRPDTIKGWAAPLIKEQISKATLPMILEAIKPDLEKVVSEMVKKEFANYFMGFVKEKANETGVKEID